LLGYTGAVFRRFFGTSLGIGAALAAMMAWVAAPTGLFFWRLRRKDF
jgi:Cu-processing system permease protein